MNFDFEKYTIDELVDLKSRIGNYINNYEDGYAYICRVRSYGRIWNEGWIKNVHSLQNLCWEYNGDNGIVDVYTTNPNLPKIDNYGDIKYIKSIDDYNKWCEYNSLLKIIESAAKDIEEWENRDNVPFNQRPYFEPVIGLKQLDDYKRELINFDINFSEPISYLSIWGKSPEQD